MDLEFEEKPWIHVPEDYIGRYEENVTSESYCGLCTVQFSSCWPIIIVYQPNKTCDTVKASLMHYGDASSPQQIKLEIDHMIQNKIQDKFVFDNCYIFIYRQLARKMTWSTQKQKNMLIQMLETHLDKQNLKIIDLPPTEKNENLGFIGIKFDDLNKIKSIKSGNQLNAFITRSVVLLEREDRNNFVHKNPFYLIRHPQELHLRCCQAISPIFGVERNMHKSWIIFDKSHWVNIDKHICHDEFCIFMDTFSNKKKYKTHCSIIVKCREEYKQTCTAMDSIYSDDNITAMAVAVQLWHNNFDLKQLFAKTIQKLEERVQNPRACAHFMQFVNERCDFVYKKHQPYTKKQIVDFVVELKDILKQENWVFSSERIYTIANELYPISFVTPFSQIYSHILIYIYHSKLKDIAKLSTDFSIKGKEMYINNKFDDAILYFSKSLQFGIMCFVDPSRELTLAYYNLGSAYQKNTNLLQAKRIISIAENICNQVANKESVNTLSQKISKRLSEIIIDISLDEMSSSA